MLGEYSYKVIGAGEKDPTTHVPLCSNSQKELDETGIIVHRWAFEERPHSILRTG